MFGSPAAEYDASSNRSLLMELCQNCKLVIGNTLFDEPVERQITCYNVGKRPTDEPSPINFGQIYFVLVSKTWADCLCSVFSDRSRALASHHFVVRADIYVQIPKAGAICTRRRLDYSSLRQLPVAHKFAAAFSGAMDSLDVDTATIDEVESTMAQAFHSAASLVIPKLPIVARHPWISDRTMDLIQLRTEARKQGSVDGEKSLNDKVKQSVKADRSLWLEGLLATGD